VQATKPHSEMTYTVSSGTLNPSIPYHSTLLLYRSLIELLALKEKCSFVF